MAGGGAQASLQLLIELKDEASQGLQNVGHAVDDTASKGGILKDAMGFAAGGLLTQGISSAAGAVSDFFGSAISESNEAAQGMAQLNAVLASTHGAAGVTAQAASDLANSLGAENGVSMASDDAVLKGENLLLTFTNIGSDVFPQATQTMVDMAQAMGTDVSGGAIQLGKALNDPTQGLSALTRVGVTFSDQQKDQIKTMQDAGDMAGAQKVMLDELAKEFGGSAAAAADTFAGKQMQLSEAFKNVEQGVGDALMPTLVTLMGFLSSPEVMGAITGLADGLATGITTAIQILTGAVNDLMPTITGLIQFVQDNAVPILIVMGSVILSQVVPAFILWATTMLTETTPAFIAMMSPVIAAAAPFVALGLVIAGLFVAFQTNFLGIQTLVQQAWAIIQPIIQPFITAFQTFFNTIGSGGNIMGAIGQLFQNLGAAIAQAGPLIGPALQQLGTLLWTWIQTAAPQVMSALGSVLSGILSWITTNGPPILAQLGQWALAFAGWVLGSALPWLLTSLAQLLAGILGWIISNGPGIIAQLLTWAIAFGAWVLDTALPALLSGLGTLISAVWNWITSNAPGIYQQLQTWKDQFFNWVFNSVLPQLPGWLANIVTAIWGWLSQTALDLGAHLVNEWLPAFWTWITGPGGILAGIGAMLQSIAQKIWDWITQAASDAATKVLAIGTSIVDGIKQGISNGWQAFLGWLQGLLGGAVDAVKNFFGIHSPSQLMADIFVEIPNGMVQGLDAGMPAVKNTLQGHLADIQALAQGAAIGGLSVPMSQSLLGGLPVAAVQTNVAGIAGGLPGLGGIGGGQGQLVLNFTGLVINAGPGTQAGPLAAEFVAAVSQQVGDRLRQLGVY